MVRDIAPRSQVWCSCIHEKNDAAVEAGRPYSPLPGFDGYDHFPLFE
jgi:hypothetical protein